MQVCLPPVSPSAAERRQRAWSRAADLGRAPRCCWSLERFKISVAIREGGSDALPDRSGCGIRLIAGLHTAIAGLLALCLLILHVARHRAGMGQVSLTRDALRVIALHAEDTTRTRHVLQALGTGDRPVAGIILLGRVRLSSPQVRALWPGSSGKTTLHDLPLVIPMSPVACLGALADLPRQMVRGIRTATVEPFVLPFREEVAIAFRLMLGLIAARWWRRSGSGQEILFGHTGTADTALLEHAMQRSGARTVHLIHGQATGPNFLAFSDAALFRSHHDAEAYRALGCYGRCDIQPAARPDRRCGPSGLLLLSNLAHPMNAGFREAGIADEVGLLRRVANVARALGPDAAPLLWKPHPVVAKLPAETQAELRSAAKAFGFVELDTDSQIEPVAAGSRWVVSSPSTVALDLLQAGVLCVLLDPQGTLLDTALRCLPVADSDGPELKELLLSLSGTGDYSRQFLGAWEATGPARPLDLALSSDRQEGVPGSI